MCWCVVVLCVVWCVFVFPCGGGVYVCVVCVCLFVVLMMLLCLMCVHGCCDVVFACCLLGCCVGFRVVFDWLLCCVVYVCVGFVCCFSSWCFVMMLFLFVVVFDVFVL